MLVKCVERWCRGARNGIETVTEAEANAVKNDKDKRSLGLVIRLCCDKCLHLASPRFAPRQA
jgi:hypothetical protein